jgi:hemolysin activation/secretion protein
VLVPFLASPPMAARAAPPERTQVTDVQVVGDPTVLSREVHAIADTYRGRQITRAELHEIGTKITRCYLDNGYLTSRATADLRPGGVLIVTVHEGTLGEVIIDNQDALHLRDTYVKARVSSSEKSALNADELESRLRLLRSDPSIQNLEASLTASSGSGVSNLKLHVTEASPLDVVFTADTYGPPSTGSSRLAASLVWQDVSGFGDSLSAFYGRSTTGGSEVAQLGYAVPVNALDGKLRLEAWRYRTKTTEGVFEDLDIEGARSVYSIRFRQPVVRTFQNELAFSAAFTYGDGQTFLFEDIGTPFGIGPDENGESRTSVAEVGGDYAHRGARTAWVIDSRVRVGTTLLDATQNPGTIPDGQFVSVILQAQFARWFGSRNQWMTSAIAQLTHDPLLSSEQFVLGGVHSVRGYRQNARIGDQGYRWSTEDRITVLRDRSGRGVLLLIPFVDGGSVENVPENPNLQPDERRLLGAGVGVSWEPVPGLAARVDYGHPFETIEEGEGDLQDDGLYVSFECDPVRLFHRRSDKP